MPTPTSNYVHDIDHSPLEPDPALGAAIAELPGRKLILTNGTREHAAAVLKRLEINPHFEDVFGIIEAEFDPKPLSQTYERFFARHAVDPARAAMFEDLARNLEVPHRFGMTTVLVVPEANARSRTAAVGDGRARCGVRRSRDGRFDGIFGWPYPLKPGHRRAKRRRSSNGYARQ